MSLQVQISTLLLMVASGAALGAVFDTYRVICSQLSIRRWMIHVIDLLYWCIATLAVFRVLFGSNSGEVRIYVFLGLALGISAYFALLSPWMIRVVLMLIRFVRTVIRLSIRLFQLLIIRPLQFLYRCIVIVFSFIGVISVFLYKVMIQLVYPLWAVIRWVTKPVHRYFSFLTRWKAKVIEAAKKIKGMLRRTK